MLKAPKVMAASKPLGGSQSSLEALATHVFTCGANCPCGVPSVLLASNACLNRCTEPSVGSRAKDFSRPR